ncbi:MAG: DUF4340 domain-containing protein [Myxococcota bacterium]
MNPRTTGILAVVALFLGLFVWFHEIEGDAAREAVAEAEKQVFTGFDAAAIDAVSLTTLDGVEARFERREGRWWLVSPILARADATALDAITNALSNLPREGRVSGDRAPAAFGLGVDRAGEGFARRIIRFEVAGEARGLRVGRTTPVGGHRYVARLADDAVAYVESFRVNAFERNLADLRDRDVFTFATDAVERIEIDAGDGARAIVLAREGDAWRLVAPFAAEADEEVVRRFVSNLAHLRARDFVDEPAVIAEATRAETRLRLRWRLAGETALREARIAGAFGEGRLLEAGDAWFVVAEERVEDFPIDVEAYRWKRLADFDLDAARRVELHFVEAAADQSAVLDVVVERGPAGWASDAGSLEPDRVTRLVRELSNLRATSILADDMGEAERAALGLSPPRARLRVEGGADAGRPVEVLADLRFGRFDATRGLLVQRADRDTVFVLEPAVAEGLPYSAAHYRFAFETAEAGDADPAPEVDPLEGPVAPSLEGPVAP